MGEVIIPYRPRPLQAQIHEELKRWNLLVCHRRFGKTVLAINQLLKSALTNTERAPRYAYLAPLRNQAKAIAWDYLKFYSAPVPGVAVYENELRVDYPTGARIQLFGCDNPDSLRGMYLDGVVLDEYGQMPSWLWGEVLRPALSDRRGYAIFLGTPRGKNAFYDLYIGVKDDPEWLVRVFRASETGIIADDELADARKTMEEGQYKQEYECSWAAAIHGAYYAALIEQARDAGRIGRVPYDPALKVHTAWDLGLRDATAIWFIQVHGAEVRVIDYYEASGFGLDHYAKYLTSRGYVYGDHIGPHDIKVRELGTGKSRLEVAESLGIKFRVAPDVSVADGVQAVRDLIPRCWFDSERCKRGVEVLTNYRQEWDDARRTFRGQPLHDWASHGADALRYFAVTPDVNTTWRPLKMPALRRV